MLPRSSGAEFRMLVVETIAKIRRAHFVQGKALEAISRELKISRKVVAEVIRSGATAFADERTVQPQPQLGPWREALEQRLETNAKTGGGRSSPGRPGSGG